MCTFFLLSYRVYLPTYEIYHERREFNQNGLWPLGVLSGAGNGRWYLIRGALICLLLDGGGKNIESYLKSELLLQHGPGQVLGAKMTVLAGTSFENKPELSLAQDVYSSHRYRLCCPGSLIQPCSIFHIFTMDKQHCLWQASSCWSMSKMWLRAYVSVRTLYSCD